MIIFTYFTIGGIFTLKSPKFRCLEFGRVKARYDLALTESLVVHGMLNLPEFTARAELSPQGHVQGRIEKNLIRYGTSVRFDETCISAAASAVAIKLTRLSPHPSLAGCSSASLTRFCPARSTIDWES